VYPLRFVSFKFNNDKDLSLQNKKLRLNG